MPNPPERETQVWRLPYGHWFVAWSINFETQRAAALKHFFEELKETAAATEPHLMTFFNVRRESISTKAKSDVSCSRHEIDENS